MRNSNGKLCFVFEFIAVCCSRNGFWFCGAQANEPGVERIPSLVQGTAAPTAFFQMDGGDSGSEGYDIDEDYVETIAVRPEEVELDAFEADWGTPLQLDAPPPPHSPEHDNVDVEMVQLSPIALEDEPVEGHVLLGINDEGLEILAAPMNTRDTHWDIPVGAQSLQRNQLVVTHHYGHRGTLMQSDIDVPWWCLGKANEMLDAFESFIAQHKPFTTTRMYKEAGGHLVDWVLLVVLD